MPTWSQRRLSLCSEEDGPMTFVSVADRVGVVELTYRAGPGDYYIFYCDLGSRRCSCARWEPAQCRHLADAQSAQDGPRATAAAA